MSLISAASSKLWIVLIGVTQYRDKDISNLKCCAKDCRGLAEALKIATKSFHSMEIIAHYDGASHSPELASILTSIEKFREAEPEDTVLFYFSGHGFLDRDNRPILCVADTELADLAGTGLKLDTVLDVLTECKAKRQVVWLDACQRQLNIQSNSNPNAQLLDVLKEQAEQSQNFSAMLSCDRGEYSWEIPELGHGLFTYYLIKGLRGKAADETGEIRVQKLFRYVSDRIKKHINHWNSPERFQLRQENSLKGIVINPSRSQTPQQIFRGNADIVLGKAVTATKRQALVIKTLAVSEAAVNFCQILQGKGGFEVDYYFPEDKEEGELERAIALCLQSASKTVLLYLAGKIEETDKSVNRLWLSDSAYITLNWLKQQFMKECLNLPELGERVQQSHILVLSYFTEEQYRQIITQAARQVGITVEEELVRVLLEELQISLTVETETENLPALPQSKSDDSEKPKTREIIRQGNLPLLQFALAELWRKRTPGSLTLQDYQQHIGGIAKILGDKADSTYKNLTKAQQECAQWILLSLVQLGEGKEDTRRRLTRSQLLVSKYDKDRASRELFQSTLQALIDARLIVVSLEENNSILNNTEKTPSASSNSEVTVEVIHEILIRNWQTLRWWLDANRDRLRLMREIEQQAGQWQENQQNKVY